MLLPALGGFVAHRLPTLRTAHSCIDSFASCAAAAVGISNFTSIRGVAGSVFAMQPLAAGKGRGNCSLECITHCISTVTGVLDV